MGGIFNVWYDPRADQNHIACSIVTTFANELMSDIHNSAKRMPFVVKEELWTAWAGFLCTLQNISSL